jgi:hypothetical protein
LRGPFCHVCGQRDLEFHRSFHHLLHEAVETLLHIDLSVGRGCFDLLFRPGRMTREFNEGRRARHVPPLRFYLVISLLFFLMFSLHSVRLDLRITFGNLEVKGDASTLKPQTQEGTISREVEERIIGSLRQPDQLVERFVHRLPKAMAVCVPLFALFSRLLFWPGPWSYLQHLILAVHRVASASVRKGKILSGGRARPGAGFSRADRDDGRGWPWYSRRDNSRAASPSGAI